MFWHIARKTEDTNRRKVMVFGILANSCSRSRMFGVHLIVISGYFEQFKKNIRMNELHEGLAETVRIPKVVNPCSKGNASWNLMQWGHSPSQGRGPAFIAAVEGCCTSLAYLNPEVLRPRPTVLNPNPPVYATALLLIALRIRTSYVHL